MKDIILRPLVNEKSYAQSSSLNRYVFVVPANLSKQSIAEAVQSQYGVGVVSVNSLNQKGKSVRTYRNKKFISGKRSDFKKAYVTLKAGDKLPFFEAIEEAEAKEQAEALKAEKKQAKAKKAKED